MQARKSGHKFYFNLRRFRLIKTSEKRMNTLLIPLFALTFFYALFWHNKPPRPQKEESSNPERELLWLLRRT